MSRLRQQYRQPYRHQQQLQQRIGELEQALALAQAERDQYRGRVSAIESSKFWQLRQRWLRFKQLLGGQEPLAWTAELPTLPPVSFPPIDEYERWQEHYTPRLADQQRMQATVSIFPYKPLIGLILPIHNPLEPDLKAAIESVLAQVYPHWQLHLVTDPATERHLLAELRAYAESYSQIHLNCWPEVDQVSKADSALITASEFLSILNPGDLLAPEALYEMALLLNKHPEADLIYSDQDWIDEQGNLSAPAFKPNWSPDALLSRMYIGHLSLYRCAVLLSIEDFWLSDAVSQPYDLALRFTEQTDRVFHIPQVLYHQRRSSDPTSHYLADSTAILRAALERRQEPGEVVAVPNHPNHYIIRYQILDSRRVSIIIPTRDLPEMLEQCLSSIFSQSSYPNYEVIIIDNGSVEEHTQRVLQKWQAQAPEQFKVYSLNIPFNYAQINNFAVAKATGDFLLFLNNDTAVITPDWITAMVEQAQRPSIGAVGAKLLYPDLTIQHAGIVLGIAAATGHGHKHFPAEASGYLGQLVSICNYAAVTGACLMCRKAAFIQVGGFEEKLAVSYNDIDLCLKFLESGLRNVYLPHVKLYHYESKSRGQDTTPAKQARFFEETAWMQQRWPHWMQRDPYYNPNLTTRDETYQIRDPETES